MKIMQYFFLAVIFLNLVGCKSMPLHIQRADQTTHVSAKEMFNAGEKALAQGYYSTAARQFEKLDSEYPFSKYSEQSMRNLIYAYYKNGDHAQAAATAQRYIHLYPRSRHVDYAYYMEGVANFESEHGLLSKYFPIDTALRDNTTAIESYNDFKKFIGLFPRSQYVPDAKRRMIHLRNKFASKELYAARYYLARKAYVAAVNRANYIIEHFQQAPETEEALAMLVKANRQLHLPQQANNALRVLTANYPHSKFLAQM